jgi:hypothetical protein
MPVPPKNLFVVEQASCLLLKKLVKNAAKYQIKHSYSLFLLPSSLFLLPSSLWFSNGTRPPLARWKLQPKVRLYLAGRANRCLNL